MVLPEVMAYLAAYTPSLGLTIATNLFEGIIRPDPDFGVWISEHGGLHDEPDMGTGNIRLELPQLQVIVRGVKEDYTTPRLLAQQIRTALSKVGSTQANSVLSGVQYKAIIAMHAVTNLPLDDNFRWRFTCNYQVWKDYSPS